METTNQLIERQQAELKAHEAQLAERLSKGWNKLYNERHAEYMSQDNPRRPAAQQLYDQLSGEYEIVRMWLQVIRIMRRERIFGAGVLKYHEPKKGKSA